MAKKPTKGKDEDGDNLLAGGLNLKQTLFCQAYVSEEFYGHGSNAYIAAYGLDETQYNTAKINASKLLTNANILTRINELLSADGLNDEFVDKQLLHVITQNAEFSSKVAAIREYNKLKQRIVDKIDHTTKGKEIRSWVVNTAKPKDEDEANAGTDD